MGQRSLRPPPPWWLPAQPQRSLPPRLLYRNPPHTPNIGNPPSPCLSAASVSRRLGRCHNSLGEPPRQLQSAPQQPWATPRELLDTCQGRPSPRETTLRVWCVPLSARQPPLHTLGATEAAASAVTPMSFTVTIHDSYCRGIRHNGRRYRIGKGFAATASATGPPPPRIFNTAAAAATAVPVCQKHQPPPPQA